jgi:hypothetical protein
MRTRLKIHKTKKEWDDKSNLTIAKKIKNYCETWNFRMEYIPNA